MAPGRNERATAAAQVSLGDVEERLESLFANGGDGGTWTPGRRRLLSPLEIHFSQAHIRPEFQDGRSLEDGALEAREPARRERLPVLPPVAGGPRMWQALGAPCGEGGSWWLLQPAFPEIEVIQWRCKIRDEDGNVKVDEAGNELYGEREWYTLDNRRLYCLQRAAASLHPEQVRCMVRVVQQEEGNCREFRKFRTQDLGRTVAIGHRESPDLPRWSWRAEVGLPQELLTSGTTISKPRRRGPNSGRGRGSVSDDQGNTDEEEEEEGEGRWGIARNAMVFLVVYASLRVALAVGRRLFLDDAAAPAPRPSSA